FINLRRFGLAINVVRGKYDALEGGHHADKTPLAIDGDIPDTIKDESQEGEVSHFQALATAVSGTVGLGNIAGVALAIAIGGPGATFWMIICGLLSMSTKFVECTLGVKYRDIDIDGTVYGGPMYYMSKGLKEMGASFGGGNAFQSNQAAAQIIERFGIESSSGGTIIGMNFTLIDDAIAQIISEAFSPRATVVGGFIGVMIQGFRRAAFSNEAGAGSAAIAHSAVNTKYAASEGLVALLEPFIDTVLICTMTALVIVIFNTNGIFAYGNTLNDEVLLIATGERIGGVNLTSMAFDSTIPGFSYVLAIAVVLFAFSTAISWSYYGLQAWKYLFGKGKVLDLIYKVVFLLFTVLGAAVTMEAVIKFSDAMILALVFPNMIGLFLLYR
ncbi:unnamed protein product, partial [Cyprideis torosa]